MRAMIVVLLLAGCAGPAPAQEAPSDGPAASEEQAPEAPPPVPAENVTGPSTAYYNGTIQNAGQCIVWSQDQVGAVVWHELAEGSAGMGFEATFDAVAGPPPAVIGATGACIAFVVGATMSVLPPRGTVPDGATRVAALTDGMVDGRYSIRVDA